MAAQVLGVELGLVRVEDVTPLSSVGSQVRVRQRRANACVVGAADAGGQEVWSAETRLVSSSFSPTGVRSTVVVRFAQGCAGGLVVAQEPEQLERCECMLLYLNASTWTYGEASAQLAREVSHAMDLNVRLLLAHEMIGGEGQEGRGGRACAC